MKTSAQWWDEVKADHKLLEDWLVKQYRGEVTAAHRINRFADQYSDTKHKPVLAKIAEQEAQHAEWIKELLSYRHIAVDSQSLIEAENRYWKETLPGIDSFETGCAVAAHAERMRLERIKVISEDVDAPEDIRETFKKILKDELFHEIAFRSMSTPEAMNETQDKHELGLIALGLAA